MKAFLLYRFCAGDWICDLLQDWALHTLILLLLLGHSSLPAGHHGCGHAHLEHSTSPRWLPRTSSYNHQSLTCITFPPTSRQWLRGIALLSHGTTNPNQWEVTDYTDGTVNHPCFVLARSLQGDSFEDIPLALHSWSNMYCNYKIYVFLTSPSINKDIRTILLLGGQKITNFIDKNSVQVCSPKPKNL